MNNRPRKKTVELHKKVVELYDLKETTFDAVGKELGISGKYASELYKKDYTKIPDKLMETLEDEFNGLEKVTVTFYNPNDKGNGMNQLTITTSIKSGLIGSEREIAIAAAIQKNDLLKWMEV
jgi:hypothetical protein